MKTSDLLQQAKQCLWDGVTRHKRLHDTVSYYICISIRAAARSSPHFDAEVKGDAVIKRIDAALGQDGGVVTDWLRKKGYAQPHHLNDDKLVQQYRHRWLDALIAEYKSKGD